MSLNVEHALILMLIAYRYQSIIQSVVAILISYLRVMSMMESVY